MKRERKMNKENYEATDSDLPAEFFDQPHSNQLTRAQDRIRLIVADMGIVLDAEQIEIFAIVLVGLEQTEAPHSNS
jgi:hypothetical protein